MTVTDEMVAGDSKQFVGCMSGVQLTAPDGIDLTVLTETKAVMTDNGCLDNCATNNK